MTDILERIKQERYRDPVYTLDMRIERYARAGETAKKFLIDGDGDCFRREIEDREYDGKMFCTHDWDDFCNIVSLYLKNRADREISLHSFYASKLNEFFRSIGVEARVSYTVEAICDGSGFCTFSHSAEFMRDGWFTLDEIPSSLLPASLLNDEQIRSYIYAMKNMARAVEGGAPEPLRDAFLFSEGER